MAELLPKLPRISVGIAFPSQCLDFVLGKPKRWVSFLRRQNRFSRHDKTVVRVVPDRFGRAEPGTHNREADGEDSYGNEPVLPVTHKL